MKFSQRFGYEKSIKEMQFESMDVDLKNSLWNAIKLFVIDPIINNYSNRNTLTFINFLWADFFKLQLNDIPKLITGSFNRNEIEEFIRNQFFYKEWYYKYNFIEFCLTLNYIENKNEFVNYLNEILKREFASYRVIENFICPISNEIELNEIEEAFNNLRFTNLKPVDIHLKSALEKLSDRVNPDYRNSIKESISAIDALSIIINNGEKADFSILMKNLSSRINIHKALSEGFKKIYGYTSDSSGIRHALTKEPNLDFEDAKYMLVSCSAFINYLIIKCNKVGIKLV